MIEVRAARGTARSLVAIIATIGLAVACSGAPTPATPGPVPPEARLVVVATGDSVVGQLGTYAWLDGGSSSPWLPGEPVVAPARADLRVGFDPALPLARWTATVVPAPSDGPAGSIVLGNGEGRGAPVDFGGPGAGAWTIHLHVVYADGLGEVSWFWAVTVE